MDSHTRENGPLYNDIEWCRRRRYTRPWPQLWHNHLMMILDLPTLPLQPLADRYWYNLYNNVFTMTRYNDCMQCCPLEDFIWWNSCSCYAPWMLLLSFYPFLHLAFLFCRRNSDPLQPLTTHDLAFSCLLGARYWIWCISFISDPKYVIFSPIVVL